MGNSNYGQFFCLFLNNHTGYRSSELLRSNVKVPEHPFYRIDIYLSSKMQRNNFWNFERNFNNFLYMQEVIGSSFDQFQFEYSLLMDGRSEYLNFVVLFAQVQLLNFAQNNFKFIYY